MNQREIRIRLRANELYFGTGNAGGVITRSHRAESQRANVAQSDLFAVGSTTSALLPPTTLNGWLENGCQSLLLKEGLSPCAGVSDEMAKGVTGGAVKHEKDKQAGYHSKGACIKKEGEEGCLIAETFGTIQKPGILLRESFIVHALRGQAIDAAIAGNGGYGMFRITHIAPRSREEQVPYMPIELERIAFVDGAWRIQVRPNVPEEKARVVLGMLVKAVEFLHEHRMDYKYQMGGRRNFGAGIVECEILNPLYDLAGDNKSIARRVFKGAIEEVAEEEVSEEQQAKETALLDTKDEDLGASRRKEKAKSTLGKKLQAWDEEWTPTRQELVKAFEDYVKANRERFSIENFCKK